jgi:hypothetical protein
MVMWTGLTWVFTPLFIRFWGYRGVAPAAVAVALTVFIPVVLIKRMIGFDIWRNVGKPFIAAGLMGLVLYFVTGSMVDSLPAVFLTVGLGAIIYSAAIFLLAGRQVRDTVGLVIHSLKKD